MQVDIHLYFHDEREVMHGVGQRLSSKNANASGGDVVIKGGCQRAIAFAEKQRGSSQPNQSFIESVVEVFHAEEIRKKVR